ncbi:MAG TPA: COG1361 S-layer family protein [Candidatus Nanoarchaeia archaeon]|nr:COG1361 S-layer family protein [Candidatus Nanoarchaeia archaeon]
MENNKIGKRIESKYAFVGLMLVLMTVLFAGSALADIDNWKDITLSLVNQDPDPANTGDVLELRIGIENQGGVAAENLVLEVIPDYPFEKISGEELVKEVGTISPYQSGDTIKIVKFKLRINKDATEGQYALKIWEYEEGKRDLFHTAVTFNIDVQSKESAEIIYIDKVQLIPGKQTSITFTINNVGSAPLRDLTFSWENTDDAILPVGSDDTRYIKYIDVGDSVDLKYEVMADTNTAAGLYKLNLYLSYTDTINGSSSEQQISTIAGVYVGGETDFDVAFSESSGGETSFTIANIGSNPATSVSVIIPQQSGWSVTGSNSVIIGNLDTGDYTVASFTLQSSGTQAFAPNASMSREQLQAMRQQAANQTAPTSNKVLVQIAYTDTMGRRNTVEKEVQMSTQGNMTTSGQTIAMGFGNRSFQRNPSFISQYKWYIIGLVVLIIVSVGYFKYKREKTLNPKYEFSDLFRKKKK